MANEDRKSLINVECCACHISLSIADATVNSDAKNEKAQYYCKDCKDATDEYAVDTESNESSCFLEDINQSRIESNRLINELINNMAELEKTSPDFLSLLPEVFGVTLPMPVGSRTISVSKTNQNNSDQGENGTKNTAIFSNQKVSNHQSTAVQPASADDDVGRQFICEECNFTYKRRNALKRHMVSKHGEVIVHKCPACPYECSEKNNVRMHFLLNHNQEKPFSCSECSFTSKRGCDLKRHIQDRHSDEKSFKCSRCSHQTKRKDSLKSHILKKHINPKIRKYAEFLIHDGETDKYICPKCSFSTPSYSVFAGHIITHSEVKRFACKNCDYKSHKKQQLKSHILFKHSVDKPYKCGQCSYQCVKKRAFTIHYLSKHDNSKKDKPYKCSECSYSTFLKTTLKQHSVVHSSERPFSCSLCNSSYKRKCELKHHVQSRHSNSYDSSDFVNVN